MHVQHHGSKRSYDCKFIFCRIQITCLISNGRLVRLWNEGRNVRHLPGLFSAKKDADIVLQFPRHQGIRRDGRSKIGQRVRGHAEHFSDTH